MSPCTTPTEAPAHRGFTTTTATSTAEVALVAFRGELDLPAVPLAADALDRALRGGVRELLVDLSDLTFLDCAALGMLIEVACAANLLGARVYVFRANGQPGRLLEWARPRLGLAGL